MASQLSGLQKWKKWLNSASEETNVKFKERRDPSFSLFPSVSETS